MTRNPDWPERLNEYIIESQARYLESGLDWGAFDCCRFAFDWAEIATGQNPMADYLGKYSTQQEALEVLRANGDGTLYRACVKRLGKPVPASFGQRGDIAYRKKEKAVGIFITQGARMSAMFLAEGGFSFLPAKDVNWAFRIG